MKNPIKKLNLFHTPKSVDELTNWINRHRPEDRAALMTVMCMTWNLCSAIVDQTTEKEENDGSA